MRASRWSRRCIVACAVLVGGLAGFARVASSQTVESAPSFVAATPKPPDVSAKFKPLIGMYGTGKRVIYVLEKEGALQLEFEGSSSATPIKTGADGAFRAWIESEQRYALLSFEDSTSGTAARLKLDGQVYSRSDSAGDSATSFRIQPVRPLEDLRREALAASPPAEGGKFREPDLVELAPLDRTIRLDIRYATNNDFLGTPVYTQARAFLQRPAAEALVRAHRKLQSLGYGLLIHDAYRPWYVTKIFWDATPAEGKNFVANPSQGSRHNRGCAVDLTMYDLHTGKPVEMPGTYDEMSARSYPGYPGGTSLQRWHRALLRQAMESEGFTVYEYEWWHFDYKDWREYPLLNIPFEKLRTAAN